MTGNELYDLYIKECTRYIKKPNSTISYNNLSDSKKAMWGSFAHSLNQNTTYNLSNNADLNNLVMGTTTDETITNRTENGMVTKAILDLADYNVEDLEEAIKINKKRIKQEKERQKEKELKNKAIQKRRELAFKTLSDIASGRDLTGDLAARVDAAKAIVYR